MTGQRDMSPSLDATSGVPRHVAIVMDGNGRWAQQRHRPRLVGHRAGARAVKRSVEFCLEKGISALTLFAFSSENWNRPAEEVGGLMKLFLGAIDPRSTNCIASARGCVSSASAIASMPRSWPACRLQKDSPPATTACT